MPRYEFQCLECSETEDFILSIAEMQEEMDLPCSTCPTDDDLRVTLHRHILGIVSIGAVAGGGGSPAR